MENQEKKPKLDDDVGSMNDNQKIVKLPYPPLLFENYYEDNLDSGFEIGFIPNFFDF